MSTQPFEESPNVIAVVAQTVHAAIQSTEGDYTITITVADDEDGDRNVTMEVSKHEESE